jgi:hypothetical protein
MRIKEQTSLRHMFQRDWTTPVSFINYTTLNNEHKWEDLCIQLRINKHELLISMPKSWEVQFLLMLHHRLASATHVSLCESNQ